jgi:hypothetical protein
MAILPPTIAGPPPASSPGAPSRPISSRRRLPSHRSTVTALLRPNQSLILHRPGHHSHRGNSTPPPSPLASNPHRAALPSRLPHPPRFRALALVGRLPSAPANTCLAAPASDKPAHNPDNHADDFLVSFRERCPYQNAGENSWTGSENPFSVSEPASANSRSTLVHASLTSRDTRIASAWAISQIRAAICTAEPKRSAPSSTGSPACMPILTWMGVSLFSL